MGAAYWEERGRAARLSELDAVCYGGAPDFLNGYAAWSQRRAVDRLLAEVEVNGSTRALDVGCGTGRWSRLLAARGAEVVGVDRSEQMLAVARTLDDRIDYRRMDATALGFDDDAFELATAVTVVQHLEPQGQVRAVAELVRVVRPGGHVLVIDRTGRQSAFSAAHGTFPRPRAEWVGLWGAAGAEAIVVVGQEFSWPLRLAELAPGGRGTPPQSPAPPSRRGASGWRRAVLRGLVAASYATDVVASAVAPRAPAQHVAALYRIR